MRDLAEMLKPELFRKGQNLRVLCLGSHPDDIEIGCGATLLRLISESGPVDCHWTVFSGNEQRANEARWSSDLFLRGARSKTVEILQFRESYFPFVGADIKDHFEKLKKEPSPDIILTHHRNDAHQDHRLVSELTWNTFRSHLILEYEIPKYDGDLGHPNVFFHLDEPTVTTKIRSILEGFPSQKENHWFNEETFRSILRIRGVESNSPSGYAEAFHSQKMIF